MPEAVRSEPAGPQRARAKTAVPVEPPQRTRRPGLPSFPRLVNVADFRLAAKKRLPRGIFDFVDGAAGHEFTMRANEAEFRRYRLVPRLLVDVSTRDLGTSVLGDRLEIPILLGPSGMQRLVHKEGELAAARAAAIHGAGYVLSVGASHSLEAVADAGKGAVLWFQIYLWDTLQWTVDLLSRARAAGYRALCVTVDSKSPGPRKYRDLRNGITSAGPQVNGRSALDALTHPRWLAGYLSGPPIRAVHLVEDDQKLGASLFRSPSVIQRRMSAAATWDDVGWLRRHWDGPLVVKGVTTADDAGCAFDQGADAVICSNHGGRILDGVGPSLAALPSIAEVAARRGKEVLVDGGVRTGADIVKALSLGAKATLIARPFWWGLAVGGEAGVVQVLDHLRGEFDSTMTMIGRATVGDLGPDVIAPMASPFSAPPERS